MQNHPLLTNTTATSEDLAAWKAIWMRHHPQEIAQLIGSREWIAQERERAYRENRRFVAVKSLKRAYAHLLETTITQTTGKGETEYGKELSIDLINRLELCVALANLRTACRDMWILHAWEEMTYPEIAEAMDTTVESVRTTISEAGRMLAQEIFEVVFVLG